MSNASDKLGFALVGFGAWGSHHAQAIAASGQARLVAIACGSDRSAQAAREQYPDVEVSTDLAAVLARPDVEAVAVAVPNHLHAQVAAQALEAGKHVLLEKPMAISVADCDRLVELARAKERVLAVGHELRLSTLWGAIKRHIQQGTVGQPKYVLVQLFRRGYRLGSGGWRFDPQRVGNWILEEPIHFFDLARWYLQEAGEPQSVYAQGSHAHENHPEMCHNFSATVSFGDDAYAVITQTNAGFEHHLTVQITGTEGALWAQWSGVMDRTLSPTFNLRLRRGEEVTEEQITAPAGEVFELRHQVDMMVDAVRRGTPPAATGEDGRWAVHMCLAATESLRRGEPVRLS